MKILQQKKDKVCSKIMDYMREVITEYQENGDLYNLEATPGEGTL